MKADIFVQGRYLTSIDLPGDSLLALLACGMIAEGQLKLARLQRDLTTIDGVLCTITLSLKDPVTYAPSMSIPKLPEHQP